MMETQQQRRRKQEKPRHLNNNQDEEGGGDEAGPNNNNNNNSEQAGDLSSTVTDDCASDFSCRSCRAEEMPGQSAPDDQALSCRKAGLATPRISWDPRGVQGHSRTPAINLLKKKFPFVQAACKEDPLVIGHRESATNKDEASEAKKMRMSDGVSGGTGGGGGRSGGGGGGDDEEEDEDDEDVVESSDAKREDKSCNFFKSPSMNVQQLNMLLVQLQHHQIIHWQVLEAVRKKVVEDKIPADSDVFKELSSLLLRHQKEIGHISATYQLAVGFLNRSDAFESTRDSRHSLHRDDEGRRNGVVQGDQIPEAEKISDLRRSDDSQARDHHHHHHNQGREDGDDDEDEDDEDEGEEEEEEEEEDDDEEEEDENGEASGQASFKCSLCGGSFQTKEGLKIHFEQHVEHKISACPESQLTKTTREDEIQESIKRDHLSTESNDKRPENGALVIQYSEGNKERPSNDVIRHCIQSQTGIDLPRNLPFKRENPFDTMAPTKANDFKSPLLALSSMSSALNFTKTPMSLMFPGESSLIPSSSSSSSSSSYQPFRYGAPTNLMKSAILASNGHEDPLEQYMEIQITENPKMEELIKEGESKVSDPNECAICHRVLSCRSALQMHYRTHTGERPYKCKLCSRTFTTKGNLKTHMSVHRGKPLQRQLHKCPICSREFSNPLVLQQHFRSHTSDPQKAFSGMFSGMIPGMFMPPINPFFSYPINPNPYFNPLFSSQFAAKNLPPAVTKVFQEQRKSPIKHVDTPADKTSFDGATSGESLVVERRREGAPLRANDFNSTTDELKATTTTTTTTIAAATTMRCTKFEDISDKSNDESNDARIADAGKEEIVQPAYNLTFKADESRLRFDAKSSYTSPLVALADRVNALDHLYSFADDQRHRREGPRAIPDDFIDQPSMGQPSSAANSFLSDPSFLAASEVKASSRSDPHAVSSLGAGKASAACPMCGKMFSCKSAVDIHMRSHTKERPFRCEYCDRAFTTKGNLKQHVGTNHHVIVRTTDQQQHQQLQQQQHQPNPRISNWTSDSSSSKSASPFGLPSTVAAAAAVVVVAPGNAISSPKMEQEASGPDDALDPKCKERNNPLPVDRPAKQNPNGARYFCTICEKPFSSTSALQIHSRTHTGDRPFVCPTCNKAFTTKGNLKVHMGTHAWNKVPSRRGRRMSVEPLGPQFSSQLGKDQVMNPSILASFHQKLNCPDRFPYSLMGLPGPNLFQSKISDHRLVQGFHGKLPLVASLQGRPMCFPPYLGNFDLNKSPPERSSSILPREVTIKAEKLDNETELDLSIKKPSHPSHPSHPSPPSPPTPAKPHVILRDSAEWTGDVKPHHLALNCR